MSLKKELKENRRKKEEEEFHQMWIDFNPIYKTLESQTNFCKGAPPQNTPNWGSLQHRPDLPAQPNSLRLG